MLFVPIFFSVNEDLLIANNGNDDHEVNFEADDPDALLNRGRLLRNRLIQKFFN